MRKSYRQAVIGVGILLTLAMLTACGQKAAPADEAAADPSTAAVTTEDTEMTAVAESGTATADPEGSPGDSERPDSQPADGAKEKPEVKEETVTIAAAASLETCLTEKLIPLFEEKYPGITIEGTYDSSGKLQTQIEAGAGIDIFFSAAAKQMDALKDEGMIEESSVVNLLENKIVLIVPTGEEGGYSSFEDIAKADSIAIGDPDSVPAGQYAREALTCLGLWDEVLKKSSLGTNVTEVLNWVAEGSAKAGVVYATDAAQTDKVRVVAEAPEDSVKKVIYPVGMVKNCEHPDGAKLFIEFLQSDEAMSFFTDNGFSPAE